MRARKPRRTGIEILPNAKVCVLQRSVDLLDAVAPADRPRSSTDPAAYKPKTEFDNTPWRFDMNQNGKRMTADEFTAWMKAKKYKEPLNRMMPAINNRPAHIRVP